MVTAITESTPIQAKLVLGLLSLVLAALGLVAYEMRSSGDDLIELRSSVAELSASTALIGDRQSRIRDDVAYLKTRLEQSGYITEAQLGNVLRTVGLELESRWQRDLSDVGNRVRALEEWRKNGEPKK